MSDVICVLHVDDEPRFGDMVAEFLGREKEHFTIDSVYSHCLPVIASAVRAITGNCRE